MAEADAAEGNNGPDHNDHDDEIDDGSLPGDESDDDLLSSEDRAIEIVLGRKKIAEIQKRLVRLERNHQYQMVERSVSVDAAFIWQRLQRRCQNYKDIFLLAVKSENQPDCLQWENFNNYYMPHRIKWDRERFLARLQYVPGFDEAYAHVAFPVPNKFRNDKEIMIEICKRNSRALSLATNKLKNDRDVVKAAVTQKFHFAPVALEHASPKLRNDKRIARTVLSQEYGIRAFRFLSPKLQEDSSLAILAIKKSGNEYSASNEHLSDLPVHFRDDEDVVLEAVKRRGSNLRFVNNENGLLNDSEIVYEACRQDGAALEFAPDDIQKSFLEDKKDLLMVLGNGGGQFLKDAPDPFRENPQYIMEAVENGYTDPELGKLYDPATWPKSREFFFSLLKASNNICKLYEKLPKDVRNQSDVILAVLQNSTINDSLVPKLIRKLPIPISDHNKKILLDIIRKGCLEFLETEEMNGYMNDMEFVKAACGIDGDCIKYASDDLQADPGTVIQALRCTEHPISFETVKNLPRNVFHNATIVASMLADCSLTNDDKQWIWNHNLTSAVLLSKNVFIALLDHGWLERVVNRFGRHVVWNSVYGYIDDPEVMLAFIRVYKKSDFDHWRWLGYVHYIDVGLRQIWNNRDRVKDAIQAEPRIVFASNNEGLRESFDYMLLAVGSGREALQTCSHKGNDLRVLVDFAKDVRERLAGDGFFEFLRGIASPVPPPAGEEPPKKRRRRTRASAATKHRADSSSTCYLPLLDCGPETSIALKRRIAEYMGAPLGLQYKLLRAANENLKFWGY